MGSVLQLLKLADRYERKARLVPGLLSSIPFLPGLAAVGVPIAGWITGAVISVGLGAAFGLLLAYAASAAGRRTERMLWRRWGGPPTTRWLLPSDPQCSEQQREQWYEAIARETKLDVTKAIHEESRAELEKVIADAVAQLRHRLRLLPNQGLLQIHNEDYGFARNLMGLRWIWLSGAVVSAAICWIQWLGSKVTVTVAILATVILVVTMAGALVLPDYVRQRAERYAESFFGALSTMQREFRSEGRRDTEDGPVGAER